MSSLTRTVAAAVIAAACCAGVAAQRPGPSPTPTSPGQTAQTNPVSRSAAWAELSLRKAELTAELESLLSEYTEDYPKIKEIKYSLQIVAEENLRLLRTKPAEADRLTPALGKLLVRKIELQTELWRLLQSYKDEHPDVKRAKRKVEVFEAAIKEILG
jgi:hypothetical protein